MADRVFLTGATGFVGAHILRELIAAGYPVRTLVRAPSVPGASSAPSVPGASSAPSVPGASSASSVTLSLSKGDIEITPGDLACVGEFARALDGCRYLVHCAALYSFSPRDRAAIHAINVEATASLMTAAYLAGIERVVLTSSSAAIGHERDGRPADERDYALDDRSSAYHHSKLEQERAAFAGRVPCVAVLPTAPVGPGDWKPTPTGRLVLEFARGKVAAKAPGDGGLNLVAVEDVARVHVAALERGRPGERYVVGGENLSMDRLWGLLSDVTDKPLPKWRVPYALALTVAYADDLRCRTQRAATPAVPLEGVRMSRERMYADSSKAQRELGHQPTPVRAALERAVDWYRANGYLSGG